MTLLISVLIYKNSLRGLALTVSELKGSEPKSSKNLAKLGIVNVAGIAVPFTHRYEDRTRIYPIADLQPHCRPMYRGEIHVLWVQFAA